jgi:hypothetical protein
VLWQHVKRRLVGQIRWTSCAREQRVFVVPSWQGLLGAISAEVTRRLLDPDSSAADDFSRQHLANFVWALATLEYDPGEGAALDSAVALWAVGQLYPQHAACSDCLSYGAPAHLRCSL